MCWLRPKTMRGSSPDPLLRMSRDGGALRASFSQGGVMAETPDAAGGMLQQQGEARFTERRVGTGDMDHFLHNSVEAPADFQWDVSVEVIAGAIFAHRRGRADDSRGDGRGRGGGVDLPVPT